MRSAHYKIGHSPRAGGSVRHHHLCYRLATRQFRWPRKLNQTIENFFTRKGSKKSKQSPFLGRLLSVEVDPRTWMIHEVTFIVTGTQIIVTIVTTTRIIIVPSINIMIIVASIKSSASPASRSWSLSPASKWWLNQGEQGEEWMRSSLFIWCHWIKRHWGALLEF